MPFPTKTPVLLLRGGSKSGPFLQKVTKFQKVYKMGSRVPEIEIYRILTILDPPMVNQILTIFNIDYLAIIKVNFHRFFSNYYGHHFGIVFELHF
jgi:hypothetical protein